MIITDRTTTEEISFTRTDSNGRFTLESPVSQVALTAVTAREWGFLPKLEVTRQQIRVQLKRDCVQLYGRVALDDAPPLPKVDLLRIGGFGKDVGDVFGISVESNYRFEACLPPAEYYITFPSGFVEHTILTMVPAPDPLVVRSASQRVAKALPTAPLEIPPQSRAAFVADVQSSTRLLGFGESNHGSREFTKERVQLAIALARQHQFTLLMLEAGYGEVLVLDDYIKGANIALVEAIDKLDYWMWYTKTFRESLDELREYNRTAPPERRITLRGIDVRTTEGALDDLASSSIQFSARDNALLARLRERQGARWVEFSQDERASIRRALEQVAVDRDSRGLDSLKNRHALSAHSLLLSMDLLDQKGFWNRSRVRDSAMAQLSQGLLALDPHVRATLWAHLIHLVREYVVGAPTLGGHLATSLGRGYRVHVLLAGGGEARARGAKKELGAISHLLPKFPAYSLESVLSSAKSSDIGDITYWDFERAGAKGRHWLRGLHFVQFFGAYYPANNWPFQVLDLATFDGAILFASVTPVEPITANRRASGASSRSP